MSNLDSIVNSSPRRARKYVTKCIMAGLVPMLIASPGVGKSALVRGVANDFGMKLIDHRMAGSDPTDMNGLPFRSVDATVAEYLPFDIFPLEGQPLPLDENGNELNGWLLFLDEFNSAPKSVQAACYKLILDRMVGQRKLHPKVAIVLAGNKMTDRAIVTEMSTAMQSRVVHIPIELNFMEFLEDVAIPQNWDERIIAFLSGNQESLMDFDPRHKNHTFCCPRTWEFTDNLIRDTRGGAVSVDDVGLLAGTITPGVAVSFVQFTAVYSNMISIDTIIANPKNTRLPEDNNMMWAMITSLVNHVTDKNADAIFTYVKRFNITFQIVFCRTVAVRAPSVLAIPAWRDISTSIGKYLYA